MPRYFPFNIKTQFIGVPPQKAVLARWEFPCAALPLEVLKAGAEKQASLGNSFCFKQKYPVVLECLRSRTAPIGNVLSSHWTSFFPWIGNKAISLQLHPLTGSW